MPQITQVETLLTCCPPFPPERIKDSLMSSSRILRESIFSLSSFSFERLTENITMIKFYHILSKNILDEGKLTPQATVRKFLIVQNNTAHQDRTRGRSP